MSRAIPNLSTTTDLVPTHDPAIARRSRRVVQVQDGAIVRNEAAA